MPSYLAVFKLNKVSVPQKATFAANNTADAIATMVRKAGAFTSLEIHEYEVMEIVNGNGYRPVASKIDSQTFKYRQNLKDNSKIELPEFEHDPSPAVQETIYIPYTLEKV